MGPSRAVEEVTAVTLVRFEEFFQTEHVRRPGPSTSSPAARPRPTSSH